MWVILKGMHPRFCAIATSRRYRRTSVSGAALLEFLAVCVPLLTIVFNALEFARYSQVKMIARYASAQGARACSVYADHKYNPSGAAANAAAVEKIVQAELSPWAGKWFDIEDVGRCSLAGGSSEDEHSPVSYNLRLQYKCSYALSFCKVSAPVVPAQVTMAMQGARYARRGDSVDPMTWCAKRDATGTVCLDGTDPDAGTNAGDAGTASDARTTYCTAGDRFCEENEEVACATTGEGTANCQIYRTRMGNYQCRDSCDQSWDYECIQNGNNSSACKTLDSCYVHCDDLYPYMR